MRNSENRASREMSVGEVREQFAEMLNNVKYGNGRTVVKRHGKQVAAVISIEDLKLLERLEEILDRQAIREAEADIKAHGTVSWDDALRELGVKKNDLQHRDEPHGSSRPEGARRRS